MLRASSLRLLLEARQRYHCEYGGYLSNHLLHYVVALDACGVPEPILAEATRRYSAKLEPARPETPTDDWRPWKGRRTNFLGLLRHLDETPLERLFEPILESAAAQIWGAAFHGIISVGYGCRSGHDTLVKEGLAYLIGYACVAGKEPVSPDPTDALSATEVLSAATRLPAIPFEPKASFDDALRQIKSQLDFSALDIDLSSITSAHGVAGLADFFEQTVMPAVLDLHASCADGRDFFLLHGVTSADSLLQVLRCRHLQSLSLAKKLVHHFVRGLYLTYVRQGRPPVSKRVLNSRGYVSDAEYAKAVDSIVFDDEHFIKLAMVCREQNRRQVFMQTHESVKRGHWKFSAKM